MTAILLKTGLLMGQSSYPSTVNLAPVSPNAASLFKVLEHPAGTYTGRPEITVPLISFTSKDISSVIGLNYNSGGVKVEEIAGDVGLGWSINGSGSIVRIMRGLPDDSPSSASRNGGYYHSGFKPNDFAADPSEQLAQSQLIMNLLDLEPDLFMYSFNGRSGTFFFDGNKNIVQREQTGLKISLVQNNQQSGEFLGWKITDENGNNFYFGVSPFDSRTATEVTETTFSGDRPPTQSTSLPIFNSAWHLLDVSDINDKKHISYNYTFGQISFATRGSEFRQLIGQGPCTSYSGTSAYNTYVNVNEYKLGEIVYQKGKVKFTYSNRLDLVGGKKLIKLEHLDQQDNLVKSYGFNYDYFVATNSQHPGDELNKRLKLTSVSDNAGLENISYLFQYNPDVSLPDRLSTSVDYWGYYNGRSNGLTIIPNGQYNYNPAINFTQGADRRADPSYAIACNLEKITFPTGAERRFEWEGNVFLRDMASEMQVTGDNLVSHGIYLDQYDPVNVPYSGYRQQITINDMSGGAMVSYFMSGNLSLYCDFHFRIMNSSGGQMNIMNDTDLEGQIHLPNGVYELQLDYYYPCTIDVFQLGWQEEAVGSTQSINRHGKDFMKDNETGGGLRIRKIVDYDPGLNKEEVTEYGYQLLSDPGFTSGLLISSMNFFRVNTCETNPCISAGISSSSNYPLSTQGGAYIYYTDVTVKRPGNGRREQIFDFAFDGDLTNSYNLGQSPIIPVEDRSLRRGNLLASGDYNENGDLLKKVEMEYNYLDEQQINNYHKAILAYKVVVQESYSAGQFVPTLCYRPYFLRSCFKHLKSAKESLYGGGTVIINEKEYIYDLALAKLQPKEELQGLSGGRQTRTRYRYAFDVDFHGTHTPSEQTSRLQLQTLNYQQPLEQIQYREVGGQLSFLSGESFYFGPDAFGNLRLRKKLIHLSSTDFIQQNLDRYDSEGNLLSYSRERSPNTVYLYSYGSSYPVAEIINSDYATIISVLGGQTVADNFTLSTPTDIQVRDFLNPLRTNPLLRNAQIRTYSYKPLVGMTSQTDVKGMTTYYEYDAFQRLKAVKDQNGKVIKSYDYHYRQ